MKPGRYAAADGSFGRSAGMAMGRGVLLLAIALAIGVFLLNKTDDEPPGTEVAAGSSRTSSDNDNGGSSGDEPRSASTTTSSTTTTPLRSPKDVKVIVANASEVKGAAGRATEHLKVETYNALAPTNAPTTGTSVVYFAIGYDREAGKVAAALSMPASTVRPMPTPPPVDIKTANVLVILGGDYAPRFGAAPAGSSSSGSTTTTVSATATTSTTAKR